ncbi:MAG: zinc finger domain-containing protein [Planctomycetota bacterium]
MLSVVRVLCWESYCNAGRWTTRIYRGTGQPCAVCGHPIQQIRQGGRTTYFCPSCQTGPDGPLYAR